MSKCESCAAYFMTQMGRCGPLVEGVSEEDEERFYCLVFNEEDSRGIPEDILNGSEECSAWRPKKNI